MGLGGKKMVKRNVSIFLLLSLVLLLFPVDLLYAGSSGESKLLNGSFDEMEARPNHWTVVNGHQSRVMSVTEQVYRGNFSVKLTDLSSTTAADLQSNKVPVTAGALYEAKVYSFNLEGSSDLYLEFFDARGNRLEILYDSNTTLNEWSPILVQGAAPEGATQAAIRIYLNGQNVGTSYFDEASLSAVSENTAPVAILNGGFEDIDAKPLGWTPVNGKLDFVESSREQVYEGEFSAKLTDLSSTTATDLRSNKVPVSAGITYEAKVYSYNLEGSSDLYLEFFDARGNYLNILTGTNATLNEWNQIHVKGTAPPGATHASVRIYLNGANVGTSYFDAATLHTVSLEEQRQLLLEQITVAENELEAIGMKIPPGDAAEDQNLRNQKMELAARLHSLAEQGQQATTESEFSQLFIEVNGISLQLKRLSNFVNARSARPDTPFGLAAADSMDLVYPKEIPCPCTTDAPMLSLAKGEYEGLQAVVMPYGEDLHQVSAEITKIVDSDGNEVPDSIMRASVAPLGSVYVRNPANFVLPSLGDREVNYEGWMPDPIRSDLSYVDVPAGDMQPFWIELYADDQAESGTYMVTVTFSADGKTAVPLDIQVKVWPFSIPDQPELETSMTMNPVILNNVYGITDPDEFDMMYRKYVDFLEKFKIEQDFIYTNGPPTVEMLAKRQTKWGQPQFAAYYIYPGWLDLDLNDPATWQPEIDRILDEITAAMETYEQAGLKEKAYIYGFDEALGNQLPLAREIFRQIKERFPDLPIMTTIIDQSLGVNTGLVGLVDIWVPGVNRTDDQARIRAQQRGDKVYWYLHQAVRDPFPNWFNGYAPSDTRVLLGPMSHKAGVDGFLYYNITRWVSAGNNFPMADGILSSWDPRTYPTTNGDGSLFYPGPEGPLASQRIHNFRDGMEDYNLLNKLETSIQLAEDLPDALLVRARELLNADTVVTDERTYTKDAALYRQWREDVAQMIQKLGAFSGVDVVEQLIEIYVDSSDLGHPLVMQLSNKLKQSQHQLEKGSKDKAIKHMNDFLKHLHNNGMRKFVSDEALAVLDMKANLLIQSWSNQQ